MGKLIVVLIAPLATNSNLKVANQMKIWQLGSPLGWLENTIKSTQPIYYLYWKGSKYETSIIKHE
jgi:hypothetical protein